MARKITRKGIIKKLDGIVTKILLTREPVSVTNGSRVQLGCSHIFSRKHLSTRWDITADGNCHIQSWAENFKHMHDPYPYYNWYVKNFGQERFDNLYQRWNQETHYKTWQLVNLYEELKKQYEYKV